MENKERLGKLLVLVLLVGAIWMVERCTDSEAVAQPEESTPVPTSADILGLLKEETDLVTTEVKISKLAIYDTSKSEHFRFTDISTWKYGDRKCIIPVEITVKYGYNLKELSVNDVKISDDSTSVYVMLPKPKIIDSGYNLYYDRKQVVAISTGLRSSIGHETEEELRKKAYDQVIKKGDDIKRNVESDIEKNAVTLVESMVKSLGFKDVTVVTKNK
ncbi:MAG: DUF4230 domain-containing protein [Bacteroidaceae bacterium]|nr:DUF4230 domain-containing protein [Bacteroidaceae bacterium]